jgi:ribosomal protein L22
MLQDKVSIAKGLATSRTETVHALPSPQEMAEVLGAVLKGAIQSAQERDLDIIDAEIVALPSGEQS